MGTSAARSPASLCWLMKYCNWRGGMKVSLMLFDFSKRLMSASWSAVSRIWKEGIKFAA